MKEIWNERSWEDNEQQYIQANATEFFIALPKKMAHSEIHNLKYLIKCKAWEEC